MCACGKNTPSGTYIGYLNGQEFATLTFDGNTVVYKAADRRTKGTYVMDGNTVKVSYENGNSDQFEYNAEKDTLNYMGLMTFTKN